jgi:hypothetical protein
MVRELRGSSEYVSEATGAPRRASEAPTRPNTRPIGPKGSEGLGETLSVEAIAEALAPMYGPLKDASDLSASGTDRSAGGTCTSASGRDTMV